MEGKFLLTQFQLPEPMNFLLFLGSCEGSHNHPPHAPRVEQSSQSCKLFLPFKISHGRHSYNKLYRKHVGKTFFLRHFFASNRTVSQKQEKVQVHPGSLSTGSLYGVFSPTAELACFVLLYSYFR